jgi:hypothetical protein
VFWRLMGTGRDGTVAPSFQPTRRAMFAVWRDDAAIDDFLAADEVTRRWSTAVESWHVRLRLIDGHGRWAGADPLATIDRVARHGGPVITLTRAAIAPRALPAFVRASRRLSSDLATAPGLRAVVGIGDVPLMRLGTFAVWDDDAAALAAGGSWGSHADARRRAVTEGWFSESLFARFQPYGASGTWSGHNPIACCTIRPGTADQA